MSEAASRDSSSDTIWATFPDLLDYDSVARFLSSLCPDSIKDNTELSLGSPESFACLLHRNRSILNTLKESKAQKNLETFWTRCIELSGPQASYSIFEDQISSLREEIAPKIKKLVTGNAEIVSWTLSESPDVTYVKKVDLGDFKKGRARDVPQILFYELGSLAQSSPTKQRLQGIFCRGRDTFLVNASGTGKTRLLLEGLCHHWGLYITCRPDYNEAGALQAKLHGHIATERNMVLDLPRASALGFDDMLSKNRDIAHRRFSDVLLGHLLVFRDFLTIASTHDGQVGEDQKRKWLDAQVATSIVNQRDPFREMMSFLRWDSSTTIDEDYTRTLSDIKNLLPESVVTDGFFVVIDEANDALGEIWCSRDGDTGPYPALKELISAWKKRLAQFGVPVTFIVSGVEIPQRYFPQSSPEWSSWKWTSNTGFFDREAQEKCILSFLPPSLLETAMGEALVQRIWAWCQPRHRMTASCITMLLMDQLEHPHGILDRYITGFTGYVTHEASEYTTLEGDCRVKAPFKNVGTIIKGRPLVQSTTHEVIMHYVVTGKHPPYYGGDRIDIVSSGVGQFKDGDMQVISLDQPVPTIAAAVWLSTKHPSGKNAKPSLMSSPADFVYSTSSPSIEKDEPPPPLVSFDEFCSHFQSRWDNGDTYTPASYIALYLSHAFRDDLSLSDIFSVSSPPSWLSTDDPLSTQLVVLQKRADNVIEETTIDAQALLPTAPPVGYVASTHDDVLAWLRHERSGAFCICPPGCGAELIFILKRAGKYLLVVLRTVGRGSTTPVSADDVQSEIDCLQVVNLFSSNQVEASFSDTLSNAFKAIPNPMAPDEQLSVLRVVATFPSNPPLPSEELKGPPVAVLKTSMFKAITERLSTDNLVDTLVASMHGKRMSIYPNDTLTPIISLSAKPVNPPPSLAARKVPRPLPKKRKSADTVTDDPAAPTSSEQHTPRRSARMKALRSTTKPPALEVLEEDLTPRKRTKSA